MAFIEVVSCSHYLVVNQHSAQVCLYGDQHSTAQRKRVSISGVYVVCVDHQILPLQHGPVTIAKARRDSERHTSLVTTSVLWDGNEVYLMTRPPGSPIQQAVLSKGHGKRNTQI